MTIADKTRVLIEHDLYGSAVLRLDVIGVTPDGEPMTLTATMSLDLLDVVTGHVKRENLKPGYMLLQKAAKKYALTLVERPALPLGWHLGPDGVGYRAG